MERYRKIDEQKLIDIADAIRANTNTTDKITVDQMVDMIDEILYPLVEYEFDTTGITSFPYPELITELRGNAIRANYKGEILDLPNCTKIGYRAFAFNQHIKILKLNSLTALNVGSFVNMSALEELHICSSTVIENLETALNQMITTNYKVYVLNSLLEQYKTKYPNISSVFVGI